MNGSPDRLAGIRPEPDVGARLSARLRAARRQRGLTVRGLARRIHRSHTVVTRWELAQRQPTLLDLERLARALAIDLDGLLRGVEVDGPPRRCSSRAHSRRRREGLGAALHVARTGAGLSVWEVFTRSGVGGRRLRQIEGGADPDLAELLRLIGAYGMTPGTLLRSRLDTAIAPTNLPRRWTNGCSAGDGVDPLGAPGDGLGHPSGAPRDHRAGGW